MGISKSATWTRLAVVLTTTAAATAATAVGSDAASLSCGDTITSDVRLTRDLVGCADNGLVIGADNITLNLNGHRIDGDGVPVSMCPDGATCDVGVDNSSGQDGLRVVGGTVQEFGVGVTSVGGGESLLVRGVRTRDNTDFGMVVGEADHPRIERNVFSGNGTSGLVMFDSIGARVLHNTVSGSLGYAVALFAIDDSRVSGNFLTDDDHGILLNNGSRNTLSENTVFHTRGSAIDVGGDDLKANRIQRNRLVEDGDGIILVQAQGTLVERNIITRTGFFGFTDTGGFGVLLDGTHDTVLLRNVVTGGRGPAVWVTTLEAPGAARDDRLLGNVTNSARDDGIRVDSGATGTIVDRNTSDHNGDDGIDVDAPATTLTRNTTNRNVDLGIEAVPGVTDGGRNAASRNGNDLQCLNVSCVGHDSR